MGFIMLIFYSNNNDFLHLIVRTKAQTRSTPKSAKNPICPRSVSRTHPSMSPKTFARFCTIFIGALEAFASISVRLSFDA